MLAAVDGKGGAGLGDELSVLDLYVTVISRFGPWRTRFYTSAPKMAEVAHRVDADPRLRDSGRSGFHLMRDGTGKRHSTLNTSYTRPSALPETHTRGGRDGASRSSYGRLDVEVSRSHA